MCCNLGDVGLLPAHLLQGGGVPSWAGGGGAQSTGLLHDVTVVLKRQGTVSEDFRRVAGVPGIMAEATGVLWSLRR